MASGPVLLKTNVVHVILFNFWKQKYVEHGTVTFAIDHNDGSLLIFEEKWLNDVTVPKYAPNSHSLWVHWLLNDGDWIFWAPNATILLIDLLSKQSIMYWKIRLIEWGTVRPPVAIIWIMLCFILKWKGSIFLIKLYFWKNIHKHLFYSRFKLQMLDVPPCKSSSLFSIAFPKVSGWYFNYKRNLRGRQKILVTWLCDSSKTRA